MSNRLYIAGKIFAFTAFILASVCVLLWFRFNIRDIYDEISGKSSKRAVEEYRRNICRGGIKETEETTKGKEVTGVISYRKR